MYLSPGRVAFQIFFRFTITCATVLLLVHKCAGQGAEASIKPVPAAAPIQGRIYFPSGRRNDVRIKIRLESFNAGELSVLSDPNGSFIFRGLEPGNYTVVVDAGEILTSQLESQFISIPTAQTRAAVLPSRLSLVSTL